MNKERRNAIKARLEQTSRHAVTNKEHYTRLLEWYRDALGTCQKYGTYGDITCCEWNIERLERKLERLMLRGKLDKAYVRKS